MFSLGALAWSSGGGRFSARAIMRWTCSAERVSSAFEFLACGLSHFFLSSLVGCSRGCVKVRGGLGNLTSERHESCWMKSPVSVESLLLVGARQDCSDSSVLIWLFERVGS